ncbi:MAG: M20 family metallopeptidase [Ktedonobacteraceae bacterium]|nr:M20 family metallopeptidase [Ktedonobacteraceae bacterium]
MPQTPSTSPTYAQIYLPRLLAHQDEIQSHLETLVNIDSGTGQVEGIDLIMSYLARWLQDIGFSVTLHPSEGFGNNLVARRNGTGLARILLVGHVDTVYEPGSVQKQPFTIRDGVAYGPGVIDMKSGVVMCIYALSALAEEDFDYYDELCVVFNNDEEVGSPGSSPLLSELAPQFEIGLVLESARSAEILTHARKGSDKYFLEVRGVAAHSGAEPHKGRSAVVELAHKILAIHGLHSLLPGVTFNITRISSTETMNVVPDLASCYISVRSFHEKGLQQAATALEQIASGCSVPETYTRLLRLPNSRHPYEPTPEVMHLLSMAQAEGEALGLHIVPERKGGLSDANLLMEMGLPTLDSLGPIGGGMHNLTREFLHMDSIPLRGALLAGLLQRLCLSKSTGAKPSS